MLRNNASKILGCWFIFYVLILLLPIVISTQILKMQSSCLFRRQQKVEELGWTLFPVHI